MKEMKTIYEHAGRIYALNIYNGCNHQCIYCYSKDYCVHDIKFTTEEKFNQPEPRKNIFNETKKHLNKYNGFYNEKEVVLCFSGDPYPDIEIGLKLTRKIIELLQSHGVIVSILTKGGLRSTRDFDESLK